MSPRTVISDNSRLQISDAEAPIAELMPWTVAVIADSAQCFYELLVRRLTDPEREALWQDYIRFGELFGMPREAAPASYEAFRAYYRGKLASEEMFLTGEARYIGYATAFEIPLPRLHQPGKQIHDLIMLGSCPGVCASCTGFSSPGPSRWHGRPPCGRLAPAAPRHPVSSRGGGTRPRSSGWRARSAGGSPTGGRRLICAKTADRHPRLPEPAPSRRAA